MAQHTSTAVSLDEIAAAAGVSPADLAAGVLRSEDNLGAVKLPSYSLIDLGTTARFELMGMDASFRINVNNLLDTEYIAESNSNIHAEDGSDTWNGVDIRNFVWFGFGRTWNASLKFNF